MSRFPAEWQAKFARAEADAIFVRLAMTVGRMRVKYERISHRVAADCGREISKTSKRPPGLRTRRHSRHATSRSAAWRRA